MRGLVHDLDGDLTDTRPLRLLLLSPVSLLFMLVALMTKPTAEIGDAMPKVGRGRGRQTRLGRRRWIRHIGPTTHNNGRGIFSSAKDNKKRSSSVSRARTSKSGEIIVQKREANRNWIRWAFPFLPLYIKKGSLRGRRKKRAIKSIETRDKKVEKKYLLS